MRPHLWNLHSISAFGGKPPHVPGAPQLLETPRGRALAFDGRQDGLVALAHPLAGAGEFTVELVSCPVPGGEREQRVVYLQEQGTENRVLIETRVVEADHWFVDTFMRLGEASQTHYEELVRLRPITAQNRSCCARAAGRCSACRASRSRRWAGRSARARRTWI